MDAASTGMEIAHTHRSKERAFLLFAHEANKSKCMTRFVEVGLNVLSSSMLRILRWLESHPSSLESAWDVPRSLSLEGIADGIGVVRSALFQPMSALEEKGLLFTRQAHVLGGGRRKRKVTHITEQGRAFVLENSDEKVLSRQDSPPKIFGQAPTLTSLFGREKETKILLKHLNSGKQIHIRGLPGIGKSTLARSLAELVAKEGQEVRWAGIDAYTDVSMLMQRFGFETEALLDVSAYVSLFINQPETILIIDDIQAVSDRHKDAFTQFFSSLGEMNIPTILIGREPQPFTTEGPVLSLGPLEPKQAIQLLGEEMDVEKRIEIAERLGGHPLAILMYDDSTPLPEESDDVRTYVEHVVLGEVSVDVHNAMPPFLMLPFPVPAERMAIPDDVSLLDEHALLRWIPNDLSMEMQHLVRNVCRSNLSDDELDKLHLESIKHWSQYSDSFSSIAEFHHRIQRGEQDIGSVLSQQATVLMHERSGSFATLLDEAIVLQPENIELIGLATQHALNRAELDIAKEYLSKAENDSKLDHLRLQIAHFEGKKGTIESFEESYQALENPNEKLRLQLSVLSRALDDLVGENTAEQLNLLERMMLDIVPPEEPSVRQIVLTSIVVMKHSIALQKEDYTGASFLRDQLISIASEHDTLVQFLSAKASVAAAEPNTMQFALTIKEVERISEQLKQPLYKASLQLLLSEVLFETEPYRAQHIHSTIDIAQIESVESATANRLVARWWALRSVLEPQQKIPSIREAILRFRLSGCPNRARALSKQLHQSM
jgi:energy-coupling factor transporter ATP-binding protein EcfA2